jgi:hypothetical protein
VPVTVPSWCIGTAFWIETVATGSSMPKPTLIKARIAPKAQSGSLVAMGISTAVPTSARLRARDRHALVMRQPVIARPEEVAPKHGAAGQRDQPSPELAADSPATVSK